MGSSIYGKTDSSTCGSAKQILIKIEGIEIGSKGDNRDINVSCKVLVAYVLSIQHGSEDSYPKIAEHNFGICSENVYAYPVPVLS